MKRIIQHSLLLLMIGICAASVALQNIAQAENQGAPVVHAIHAAGVNAWVMQDHTQPLLSLQMVFEGAGSASDPKGLEGLSMFTASLLDEGAGDLDALAFQQALDAHAIELSFKTEEDALIVNLRALSEHREEAFRLLGLALAKPRFDSVDVERKRALALSTLKQAEASPVYQLTKRFRERAFTGHAYGREALGTAASLKKITSDELKNFAAQSLAKSNLVMSVAGDIEEKTLQALMEKYMGVLPAQHVPPQLSKTTLQHMGAVELVEQPIPQSFILFATPGIYRDDKRFIAGFVLNHIIGGDSLNSKLGIALRKEKGLTYGINTRLDPMRYAASWGGMFSTRNEQAGEAYRTLIQVADDLRQHGVSAEDLQKAKDYLTGAFVLSLDTNQELVTYLNIMQRFDLGKDYLTTRNQQINAVTLDEVNALAKEWLDSKNWLVVVAGKPEGISPVPALNAGDRLQ